jgi:hypothetical protein
MFVANSYAFGMCKYRFPVCLLVDMNEKEKNPQTPRYSYPSPPPSGSMFERGPKQIVRFQTECAILGLHVSKTDRAFLIP